MRDHRDEDVEISRIRARLTSLEAERAELEASLAEIERRRQAAPTVSRCAVRASNIPGVTTLSPTADKVALFRRLFAGRPDVFPLRWENPKTGKSGYSPACANEWVRGVCGKPQVKCGECATTSQPRALSWWRYGRRRDTCWACPPRSRAKTAIIRSSSCNAAPSDTGSMRVRRPSNGASSTASNIDRQSSSSRSRWRPRSGQPCRGSMRRSSATNHATT